MKAKSGMAYKGKSSQRGCRSKSKPKGNSLVTKMSTRRASKDVDLMLKTIGAASAPSNGPKKGLFMPQRGRDKEPRKNKTLLFQDVGWSDLYT